MRGVGAARAPTSGIASGQRRHQLPTGEPEAEHRGREEDRHEQLRERGRTAQERGGLASPAARDRARKAGAALAQSTSAPTSGEREHGRPAQQAVVAVDEERDQRGRRGRDSRSGTARPRSLSAGQVGGVRRGRRRKSPSFSPTKSATLKPITSSRRAPRAPGGARAARCGTRTGRSRAPGMRYFGLEPRQQRQRAQQRRLAPRRPGRAAVRRARSAAPHSAAAAASSG